MSLPDRYEFRLDIPGFAELAGLARMFLERVIAFADFASPEADEILEGASTCLRLVEAQVESTERADVPIELRAIVDPSTLQIVIIERGVPLDDDDTKASMHGRYATALEVFDESCWTQQGVDGSELHLYRKRPHARIDTLTSVEHRLSEHHPEDAGEDTGAADVSYSARLFRPDDAMGIARCIYESYGRTYPNPDLLYPDRILALNRSGHLHSIVAEASDGAIVGHYGIERPKLEPIAEVGVAAVDPGHRGKGLLQLMNVRLLEECRALDLLGIWSQPTTRHPYSMRMNIARGSRPCGLTLGTTPASVSLQGTAGDEHAMRYSCFLCWKSIATEDAITVSVPEADGELIQAIYAERAREAGIDTSIRAPDAPADDACRGVHALVNRARKSGTINVERIHAASLQLIRASIEMLVELNKVEVIYIDLPISDPSCAWSAQELRNDGFIFSGVGPHFLGGDSLRLQRMLVPVDLDSFVVEGDLATRIADHVLAEYQG